MGHRMRPVCAAVLGLALAMVSAPLLGVGPAGAGEAVDRSRPLLFRDPVTPGIVAARTAPQAAPYPLDQTFKLHSAPGSQHTIYLDFNGAMVAGTAWNEADLGVAASFHPGWSLDGETTFTPTERATVQSIWRRVAEDFAPFDVDVTTADPGQAAIDRSGPDDPVFGTRALISPSRNAVRAGCGGMCGGMAFTDVFDAPEAHDYYQPAWVFPNMLGNDPKTIAEAVSHEVGHIFGLVHDGTTQDAYYEGHRSWAPIMGSGYDRPVVQWSRGDYAGANNHEDDLAIIAANGAPLRTDEAGDSVTGAGPLPAGAAYITADADRDVYALGTCSGDVTVRARSAPRSPDLDIALTLLDAAGVVRSAADPPSLRVSDDVASGMSASIAGTLSRGLYFVAVEGVGHRGPTKGYDGYASVGAYRLTQSGCVSPG